MIDDTLREADRSRIAESVELGLRRGESLLRVLMPDAGEDGGAHEELYSEKFACPEHGSVLEELEPRSFSFNSPYGACETCDGLGTTFEVDPELVIPDNDLSINDGAIIPWRSSHTQYFTRISSASISARGMIGISSTRARWISGFFSSMALEYTTTSAPSTFSAR